MLALRSVLSETVVFNKRPGYLIFSESIAGPV